MRRSLCVVGTVAALATTLVGCGSSKGLSTADFATQANAICATLDAQTRSLPQTNASDVSSNVPLAQQVEKIYASYVSQITELTKKAADKDEISKSWTDLAAADYAKEKPLIDNLIAAAQKKDLAGVKAAATALAGVTDLNT